MIRIEIEGSGPYVFGIIPGGAMDRETDRKLRLTLAQLKQKHRDLDETITGLEMEQPRDALTITRLKKHRLQLRDQIASLEDQLLPDIIA